MATNKKTKTTQPKEKFPVYSYLGAFVPDGFGQWRASWPNIPLLPAIVAPSLEEAMTANIKILKKFLLKNGEEEKWSHVEKSVLNELQCEQVIMFVSYIVCHKKFKKNEKVDIEPIMEMVQVKHSKNKWGHYE